MKPLASVALLSILVAAAGIVFYAIRERTAQGARRGALEQKIAASRSALERAGREREAAEQELTLRRKAAEAEAAAVAAARTTASPANPAVTAWEQKIATLKAFLAQHRAWSIPEIALLSPDEFAFFARDAQLDDEDARRKALRDLRALAKRKVAKEFHGALNEFAQANGGRLPGELGELERFFKSPLPDEVLQRYALTGVATVSNAGNAWILYERAPVDELHDTRHLLGTQMSIQTFTDPAMYVISRAVLKFAEANPNRAPVAPADLEPYLEAPLDPPTFDDYFAGWKKNPMLRHEIISRTPPAPC